MTTKAAQEEALVDSMGFSRFDLRKDYESDRNWAGIIVAKRRSGKTFLMKDLLHKTKDWYTGGCYVFSGTADVQKDMYDFVPEDNLFLGFQERKLRELWERQKERILKLHAMKVPKKEHPLMLIILDDIISYYRVWTTS